jgi:hypothetical protein
MDLFRNIFQEFAAARHQANLGPLACQGESNRFADAATRSTDNGDLIS